MGKTEDYPNVKEGPERHEKFIREERKKWSCIAQSSKWRGEKIKCHVPVPIVNELTGYDSWKGFCQKLYPVFASFKIICWVLNHIPRITN